MNRILIVMCQGAAAVALVASTQAASAAPGRRVPVALPEQSLSDALQALSSKTGVSIIADAALVANRPAPAVKKGLTVEQALTSLLANSSLRFSKVGDGYVVVLANGTAANASQGADGDRIVVTGTRLRGTPVASPVVTLTRTAIADSGQASIADVARTLPQSFGGGQNPGVGFNVPSASGVNVGSGASFNLRGLGSAATLTLLNGHRLPYSSSSQGVDASSIPLLAVDRIEIIPDGASALYGSDAVAGVVNIVLRDRFEGLITSARVGGSTDGGDFQQQYSALLGTSWRTGGVYAAYEYEDDGPISGKQRDYGAGHPGLTFVPPLRSHRVLASARQSLLNGLTFKIDGFYDHRASGLLYALNAAGDLSVSRTNQTFSTDTFGLTPSLDWRVGAWQVDLVGTYGKDITRFRGDTFAGATLTSTTSGRYTNRSHSAELSANGPLFSLASGAVRVALGGGLRVNDFNLFRGVGVLSNIDASQNSRYVFGEINVPLVSPEMAIPLIDRLSVSAALRHEDYRGIGAVTTPKLGLVLAPSPDIDLRASWGRSFRAPSFIQQYQIRQAALYPSTLFSGTSFAAGSSVLVEFGGNPNLAPERASTFSATLDVHPRAISGLDVQVSYFSTRFTNRIVSPLPFLTLALSNPLYAAQVTSAPSAAQLSAALASVAQFFNITGAAYDPSRVVALVDTSNVNAGKQKLHGFDVLARYSIAISPGNRVAMTANGSYLLSRQQLTLLQPVQPLSGQLFNPPRFRARGTMTWTHHALTSAATFSYIGGVSDPRSTPPVSIHGMTTLDLTERYLFATTQGLLKGLELEVSAQNLFNAKPAVIATTAVTDTPYDSTNYSPLGRVLAVRITKRW